MATGRERLGPYSARVRSICREALIVGNCVKQSAADKPIGSANAAVWALRNATAAVRSSKGTYRREHIDRIYQAWDTLLVNGYLAVDDPYETKAMTRGKPYPYSVRQRRPDRA
jgi:hypothetical protein